MSDDVLRALLEQQRRLLEELQAQRQEREQDRLELERLRAEVRSASPEREPWDATVAEAWAEFEPYIREMPTWKTAQFSRRHLLETVLPAPDGTRIPLGQFRVSWLSRKTCADYRKVREAMPNGRGGLVCGRTVNRELTNLQSCLTWHVDEEHLEQNPIAGFKRVPDVRRKTVMRWETLQAFIAHGPPIYQDLAIVAFRAFGMRRGEVLGLLKSELDRDRHEIHLGVHRDKRRRGRIIPVPADAWAIIERHAAESRGEYVFVRPNDPTRTLPIPTSTFDGWTKQCRERSKMQGVAGEPLVFHLTRHGGLNEPLTKGVGIRDVSRAGGVSISTLDHHYLDFDEQQRDEARALLEGERRGPARAEGSDVVQRAPSTARK